jgi:hypothetical protein
VRIGVRNTLTVGNGFFVETKQGGTNVGIELFP